jgi:4-amino-4-deoxy-L-arabinose transferase-like glycosyltransferase
MERSFRSKFLTQIWDALDPQAGPPLQSDGLEGQALARPIFHVGILIALAIVYHFAQIGTKVLEGDEATYALLSKTIAMTGDWGRLALNGEPYVRKPPLYFWLTAGLFQFLPISGFSASVVSSLFGVADTLLVYVLCRAMFPGWVTAFASSLAYLTTHEVLHWSRGVHLETLVTFWLLLGLLAVYWSVRRPAITVIVGVTLAGGWLSKGVQGLYPAALLFLVWMKERILFRRLLSIWGVIIVCLFGAAVASWIWLGSGGAKHFIEGYLVKQVGAKLFGSLVPGNGYWFYLRLLLATYWPWLPAAVIGIILLARSWRSSAGARVWLLFGAIVAVAILLTKEKRTRYLFQLYPVLSVASGIALARWTERFPRLPVLFVGLTLVGAASLGVFGGRHSAPAQKTRETVLIAERLESESMRPVLITERTQHGRPRVGRTLGFYAAPLLRTCKARCLEEAVPGSTIVARSEEADRVASEVGGQVSYGNGTLAIVVVPEKS